MQLGIIKVDNIPKVDLISFTLYSYLRRGGKIVKCCEHICKDYKDYFIIYDNNESFKNKVIKFLVKLLRCEKIKLNEIIDIQNIADQISDDSSILLANVSGASITFINIKEVNNL